MERKNVDQQVIAESTWKQVEARLEARLEELGRSWLMYFARHFQLEETDNQWIEHLRNMDHLREGIGLRGYGQKDPKKEYKREGFDLFSLMMVNIQHNTGQNVFRVQMKQEEEEDVIPSLQQHQQLEGEERQGGSGISAYSDEEAEAEAAALNSGDSGEAKQRAKPIRRDRPKIGRNDPCHCGSGKKFKKCHGRAGGEASA